VFQRKLEILLTFCLAASIAIAGNSARAAAENPFIGEWTLDSSKSRMPDEMKVESKGGNTYAFDFGGGVETIVADGSFQKGLYDSLLSAKAESPDTWIVARQKDGHLMLRATWKLSANGDTLTDYYREFAPDGSTVSASMDYVYQRTGATGSGFAADWQSVKETINSPYVVEVKPYQGDGLSFTNTFQHSTRNMKFDGKDHPDEGPNAQHGSTTAARKVDDHNLVVTAKSDGKVVATEEIRLSSDLKVLTMTIHFPGRDKPNVMVFNRK
jgi:hypothetical protein